VVVVGTEMQANALSRLEKKMSPAQIAEAKKLAREWKPKPNKSP